MTTWYNEDLAYIHDVGFSDYALQSAPGIIEILQQHQIQSGLIVDLGCGTGLSAQMLDRAGYEVLGIDISEAAIAIARTKVPRAEFRVASLFSTPIPPCNAVIAIGECLSYAFVDNSDTVLDSLFQRIYNALVPGGVFTFDVVVPGHVAPGETAKRFTEGSDWIVLAEIHEDPVQQMLVRRIITLRRVGDLYRRTDEVHRLRLFDISDLAERLKRTGFHVEIGDRYGEFKLPPARMSLFAYKSKREM